MKTKLGRTWLGPPLRVDAEPGRLDDRVPARAVLGHPSCKLFRAAADRLEADLQQPLGHVRRANGSAECARQPVDSRLRRSCRSVEREPPVALNLRVAEIGE